MSRFPSEVARNSALVSVVFECVLTAEQHYKLFLYLQHTISSPKYYIVSISFDVTYLHFEVSEKTGFLQSHFLLQLKARSILNPYIYHKLPATCFGVCNTIYRQTILVLSHQARETT